MTPPASYLLCGTPRTGSTLLCALLASTGVAGHPESYFREPDQHRWAQHLGVPITADGSFDFSGFAAAVRDAGSTPNGVFAARIMWGTVSSIVEALAPHRPPEQDDVDVLNDAFGPLQFVHLQRDDVLEQAVSWARAEQTGYWQHGDSSSAEPHFDRDQIDDLIRTIDEHNTAWRLWFRNQNVHPTLVTYEQLAARPIDTIERILGDLGLEPPPDWQPTTTPERQSDEINADWIRRYRAIGR